MRCLRTSTSRKRRQAGGLMSDYKKYLGDSVYVEVENGMIKLTTDNGTGASNTIYLEEYPYQNLVKWHKNVLKEMADATRQDTVD